MKFKVKAYVCLYIYLLGYQPMYIYERAALIDSVQGSKKVQ